MQPYKAIVNLELAKHAADMLATAQAALTHAGINTGLGDASIAVVAAALIEATAPKVLQAFSAESHAPPRP